MQRFLSSYQHLIDDDRWDAVGEMLLESAAKLVRSGAQLLICPDNKVHQGLDLVRERSPAPSIHIAEEVSDEARRRGFKRLGILGTRFLMEGPVYRSKLAPAGIDYRVPNAEQRTRINQIIYDELVYARLLPESRAYFQNAIRDLADNGCDGVALACTEIPLLISAADSPLPPPGLCAHSGSCRAAQSGFSRKPKIVTNCRGVFSFAKVAIENLRDRFQAAMQIGPCR